jgi:peptide/nickel transport system substrate-binding protein
VFQVIDTVNLIDETTVEFNLKFPYAMLNDVLTHQIVNKAVREGDKELYNKEPIGSGPFKFIEWVENEYVTLERWDDYWKNEKPNVAAVKFTSLTESTSRVTALKTEQQDIIQNVPPKLWSTVEGMQNGGINAIESIGYYYAAFNCREGPTKNKTVREAIDHTVSMDNAVQNFIEPAGVRQYSPLPGPIVEEWDFPIKEWKQIPNQKNISKAKQMFEDAGVSSNFDCQIIVPPDDNRENIGISIANGIKEAGYKAHVNRYDWGTFLEKAYTGKKEDFNIYILGWVRYPDPDDFIYNLFHEESEGVYQGHFYKNSDVMEQIAGARQTTDRAKRKELYTKAITTVLQDKVHLPSFNYKNSFGVRSKLDDYQAHPVAPLNPRLLTDYSNVSIGK